MCQARPWQYKATKGSSGQGEFAPCGPTGWGRGSTGEGSVAAAIGRVAGQLWEGSRGGGTVGQIEVGGVGVAGCHNIFGKCGFEEWDAGMLAAYYVLVTGDCVP